MTESSKQKTGERISGMVDVGGKEITVREAVARCTIFLSPEAIQAIENKKIPKGDVLETARIAGIMAVKKTPSIIPHCHPVHIVSATVNFTVTTDSITAQVVARACDRTGVEMEALHGASAACLTIYDLCKFMGQQMTIENLLLVKKTGGKSGTYERVEDIRFPQKT